MANLRSGLLSLLCFLGLLLAACSAPAEPAAAVATESVVAVGESAVPASPEPPTVSPPVATGPVATGPVATARPPEPASPTPAPADTTPPGVMLAADSAEAPWDGQTTVRVTATDPSGVGEVTVLLGAQVLATGDGGELAFDLIPGALSGVEPGQTYTLIARAIDGAGNEGQATLEIRFGAASTPTATATATAPPSPVPPTAARPAKPTAIPPATSYRVIETTLPTYPYLDYLRDASDPERGNYPLRVLDRTAYEASNPQAVPKKYRLAVLENRYLRLGILPDLGGRIYECTFKPTGHNEFYSNPVVKPTGWGPPSPPYPAGANWWLAAGGLEWGFPVEEHGYEWAFKWGNDFVIQENGGVMVTLYTSQGHQRPYVAVDIILPPDTAYFVVQPHVINPTSAAFRFKWWANAMLAPGAANKPGPDLRFILPASAVTVHSTGDGSLPGPGQPISWPVYNGRDLSRLGNWAQYLGVFQRPAASGGFMGVYDAAADEGMLRIYPPDVARGAKLFAMGWSDPIGSGNWTDDGSGYVEMHGGLAPTFDDWVDLPAYGEITWSESWYPVAGIGGVTFANDDGALSLQPAGGRLRVGLFLTSAVQGRLAIALPGTAPLGQDVTIDPARPFSQEIALPDGVPAQGEVAVLLIDAQGRTAFEWRGQAALR